MLAGLRLPLVQTLEQVSSAIAAKILRTRFWSAFVQNIRVDGIGRPMRGGRT